MKKVKDMQPPLAKRREGLSYKEMKAAREGWDVEELTEQGSKVDKDDVKRQISQDVESSVESKDTAHGREEAKKDKAGAANVNG